MIVLWQQAPVASDGVMEALRQRLVHDVGRHARSVEEHEATEYRWTRCGETLLIAVWRCVHGEHERPVVLPNGDAAPARTLVEAYGLQPLVLRRLTACWN